MASYSPSTADRAKAVAAAIVVNAALGALLISGLATRLGGIEDTSLKSFDVVNPPPPPEAEPPPQLRDRAPEPDPGAPGRRAEPSPIVAPPPQVELPAPSPVVAAPIAGRGSAASAGAADSGTGPGAGGSGAGRGGGGGGGGSPTGAVKIAGGMSNRDYRQFSRLGIPVGRADMILLVDPRGRATNCRPFRGSGSAEIDRIICTLLEDRLRFRPARDGNGRAIYQDVHYVAYWSN